MTHSRISRRSFIGTAAFAGAALAVPGLVTAAEPELFKLHYAPHDGLFRASAGQDIVKQIHFAADQGFTAWEDNGMKNRGVKTQNAIAGALKERNMQMGVFVAADIDWNKPTLTTGDSKHRQAFLDAVVEFI